MKHRQETFTSLQHFIYMCNARIKLMVIAWLRHPRDKACTCRPLHLRLNRALWTLIFAIVLFTIKGAASSARGCCFLVESDSSRLSWWDTPTVVLIVNNWKFY